MDITKFKSHLIALAVGIAIGLIVAWCARPRFAEPSVRVERDTVYKHDTIPYYKPTPRDSSFVKWMVVRVPMEPSSGEGGASSEPTIVDNYIHDTIEVELPVTQKHYQADTYQAWVSGYRPNLDSIEVYQKTQIVTETITITQKERKKHWGLGLQGGYGYDFNAKTAAPFVGVGLSYNFLTF